MSDRERERLARRAAAGDLESARRLVTMLEAKSGESATGRRAEATDADSAMNDMLRAVLFREWPDKGPRNTPAQRSVHAMRESLLGDLTRMIAAGRSFESVASHAIRNAMEEAGNFASQFAAAMPLIADRIIVSHGGEVGFKTGATNRCPTEGCTSPRLAVRWANGKFTWECAGTLYRQQDGSWRTWQTA